MIVASYGGDRLIDVKKKEIAKDMAVTLEEMGLNQKNADRVCAMLWKSFETMIPLCETAEIGF